MITQDDDDGGFEMDGYSALGAVLGLALAIIIVGVGHIIATVLIGIGVLG